MYKDAKEELKRLEDALLEEDVPEEEEQPEELAEEEEQPDELAEEEKTAQDLMAQTRRIGSLEEAETLIPDLAETLRIFNADQLDVDLEEYAEAVQEEPKSITGLIITAAALAVGVMGVLVWWLVRYGAMLG